MIGIIPAANHVEHVELPPNFERCPTPHFAGEDDELWPGFRRIVEQKIIVPLRADRPALAPGEAVFLVVDHDGVRRVRGVQDIGDALRCPQKRGVGEIPHIHHEHDEEHAGAHDSRRMKWSRATQRVVDCDGVDDRQHRQDHHRRDCDPVDVRAKHF